MIRGLLNLLLGIRKIFQGWFTSVFEKFRDPSTGKLSFLSPKAWKSVALVAGAVFFLVIILIQIFTGKTQTAGGLEDFRNELTPKLGIGQREQNYASPFSDDPLAALNGLKNNQDPLANLGGARGGNNGTTPTNVDGTGEEDENGGKPTVSDCLDLIEKLKKGQVLVGEEYTRAQTCVTENIAGLSEEEVAAARELLRTDLTPQERSLIARQLSGTLEEDGSEGQAVRALLDAARRQDTAAAQSARNAIAALEAKNQELADALLKQATDSPLSDAERRLIENYNRLLGQTATGGGGAAGGTGEIGGLGANAALDNAEASANREEAARLLAQDVATREQQLQALQRELTQAQAAAAAAAEKLAKGLTLSPQELERIKRLTDLQQQRKAMGDLQEKRKQTLANVVKSINTTLTQVSLTMQRSFPSGVSVELQDTIVDCSKVRPLPVVAKGPRKKPSNNQSVMLGSNGEPLTPDQVRLVQLFRKKRGEEQQQRDDLFNPGNNLGQRMDVAQLYPEGANVQINNLTVFADKSLKAFVLTPDMKIPAVLDSQILVSDKGSGQSVRVRIIADVHNPETSEVVIPKGSLAIATTSGFDPDTGVMDLNFDKVTIGSGKVLTVKLMVGSGDGTMGLKGQVRDTRGKFLLGAFITSFTSGALNFFSQAVIQDYVTSTAGADGLIGAGLQGGSEVMNRIAEMYAGDLQNAAKIFYAPKGIPVVLFPQ